MDTKIIIGIVVLIIVIIIFVVFFKNRSKRIHNVLVKELIFLNTDYNEYISNDLLPESDIGIKSTYSFWIYFSNVPENAHWITDYNEHKPVLFRYGTPDVVYIPKEHQLKLSFTYKNPSNLKTKYDFILKDLEVQKWMNIIMVMNNRNIDIYLDGELHSSTVLNSVPFLTKKFLYIGQKNNNFNGYLNYLEYINDALTIDEAKSLYNKRVNSLPKKVIPYTEDFYKKHKNEKKGKKD